MAAVAGGGRLAPAASARAKYGRGPGGGKPCCWGVHKACRCCPNSASRLGRSKRGARCVHFADLGTALIEYQRDTTHLTIFYICPWSPHPTGGIKQIFRHVEALHDAGFDAYVLALESTMPSWFDSSAAVARLSSRRRFWDLRRASRRKNQIPWLTGAVGPEVHIERRGQQPLARRLGADDIIVLPEYFGKALQPCGFGSKLVVFNQNAHYTFTGFAHSDLAENFIYRGHVLGALGVSRHICDYLSFAFRDLSVLLTPNGVDASRFFPQGEKKKQIAFMPRKLPTSIVQVLQILRSRGALEGWTLCPIDGMSEAEVALRLRESAIFLSTCHDEGFGLPPLEAGASGCVVVGYTGYAAREFMLPQYCYPVPQGDVLEFAQTLERVLVEYSGNPQRLQQQAADYVDFLRTHYSKDAESRSVVAAWSQLCGPAAQRNQREVTVPRV
ncbi:MAG TPA: glycosyltransferase [Rhizobacter sp.]